MTIKISLACLSTRKKVPHLKQKDTLTQKNQQDKLMELEKKRCYASLLIGLLVGYDFHGDMGKKWVLVGHGLRESIGFYDM